MNVTFTIVFLICCFKGVVCIICDNLSYSQPAFKGRNVTIIYTPFQFSATTEPEFFYQNIIGWQPVTSPVMSNSTLGVFTTMFDTNLPNTGWLGARNLRCRSHPIYLNLQDPPSTLEMNVPRQPSHLQDIYTLEFSCFMDNYNDFCWISWSKDGLLYAKGNRTDRIHSSSVMVFTNVSKENNGQNITCSVTCFNLDVHLYKSHIVQVPYQPRVHLSVKDKVILNARDTTKVTCTAKSLPFSDIVWSVNGDTQIHICNKSQECEIQIYPEQITEHRNYTCTAVFKFGKYGTSATSSFLAVWGGEDSSLTNNSESISIEWIVVGFVILLAVIIISTTVFWARKLFLKENIHGHSNEHQPVQHANVQENETVELNEYAQDEQTRKTRPETVECKAEGSNSGLVYADLNIEHGESQEIYVETERYNSNST